MTWETDLRARVKTAVARVAWGVAPQEWQPPFAVLTVVNDPRPETFQSPISLRGSTVQIDIYDDDRETIAGLVEDVIAAIQPDGADSIEKGFVTDTRERGEKTPTAYLHRFSIDAVIWHN